ncbi:unnamed protein product [Acanthoscelides obtectus]|uniref:Uncharacterized protein n=1 Tax=Acanthoscelides obtectus TaxID=200917 RepID=A0A9P0P7Q6_ACAOB|nr:unnamed protein product [Acanthoscelides obtectus]CAK1646950.1 hypothetical protein AOBTE_LOCUS14970 [Acanthoscelides obtectus]
MALSVTRGCSRLAPKRANSLPAAVRRAAAVGSSSGGGGRPDSKSRARRWTTCSEWYCLEIEEMTMTKAINATVEGLWCQLVAYVPRVFSQLMQYHLRSLEDRIRPVRGRYSLFPSGMPFGLAVNETISTALTPVVGDPLQRRKFLRISVIWLLQRSPRDGVHLEPWCTASSAKMNLYDGNVTSYREVAELTPQDGGRPHASCNHRPSSPNEIHTRGCGNVANTGNVARLSADAANGGFLGHTILISNPIKTSRSGKPQPTLHIPVFQQNPFLCVATILKEYIDRTASLREPDNDFLFVTYKKPHTRASKDTLSRWESICISVRKPYTMRAIIESMHEIQHQIFILYRRIFNLNGHKVVDKTVPLLTAKNGSDHKNNPQYRVRPYIFAARPSSPQPLVNGEVADCRNVMLTAEEFWRQITDENTDRVCWVPTTSGLTADADLTRKNISNLYDHRLRREIECMDVKPTDKSLTWLSDLGWYMQPALLSLSDIDRNRQRVPMLLKPAYILIPQPYLVNLFDKIVLINHIGELHLRCLRRSDHEAGQAFSITSLCLYRKPATDTAAVNYPSEYVIFFPKRMVYVLSAICLLPYHAEFMPPFYINLVLTNK